MEKISEEEKNNRIFILTSLIKEKLRIKNYLSKFYLFLLNSRLKLDQYFNSYS